MTARNVLKGKLLRYLQSLLNNENLAVSEYSRARLKYCEAIASEATTVENVCFIEAQGVIDLIIPLIEDPQLNVRTNAINCIGRMCANVHRIADTLIERNVPQLLLRQFVMDRNDNSFFRKVVLQALTRIAKHSPENATAVSEAGAMSAFLCSLEDPNVAVKEMAVCGTGCLISKSSELALKAIQGGAIPLLLACFQSPELSLKTISAQALGDLASHSPDHARAVVEAAVVLHFSRTLNNINAKLKRNVFYALANIASQHRDLAEALVEADVVTRAIIHTANECVAVKKQSIRLIQEIAKHSMELSQLVVTAGALGSIVQLINSSLHCDEDLITPSVTTLGFISGHSPQLALAVIDCHGPYALKAVLCCDRMTDLQLAQTVWALGHVGKHTPEHSKALGEAGLYAKILEIHEDPKTSPELKKRCRCTLKLCLQICVSIAVLEPLLYNAPPDILKYILAQYSKILPNDPVARRTFMVTGGLRQVQEITADPGTALFEHIRVINSCFPQDIVQYYNPDFPNSLLERVDQFTPQPLSILSDNVSFDELCEGFSQEHPPTPSSHPK